MKINKVVSKYLNEGGKYKSPLAAFDDDDHSEYMNMILNKQNFKGKVKTNGWEVEENKGEWIWTNDDGYKVFLSPFKGNEKGIEAKGIDDDGKEKKLGTFPLELTGNTMNDFVNYMQVVKKVLNKIK